MRLFKRTAIATTESKFSAFIRTASSAKKKQVYTEVLKRATDRQIELKPIRVRCR